jgi:hypothetical protein
MDREDLANSGKVPFGWAWEVEVFENGSNSVVVAGLDEGLQAGHVAKPKDADGIRKGRRKGFCLSCDMLDELFSNTRWWDGQRGAGAGSERGRCARKLGRRSQMWRWGNRGKSR